MGCETKRVRINQQGLFQSGLVLFILLWAQFSLLAASVDPLAPVPGATNVSTSAELSVLLSGIPEGEATITFYQRATPSDERPDFTVALVGDTQFYCKNYLGGTPEMFSTQTDWIVANRTNRNIVFVGHLGDCVYDAKALSQWQVATNAMYRLEDPFTTLLEQGMPYSMCVGNHDIDLPVFGTTGGSARYYNDYFGASHFQGRSYYGGNWGPNNNNHFSFFSASGIDFIVLNLEYWPSPPALDWANAVLQTNQNRRAIIMSHSLLHPTGAFTADGGQQVYDGLKANTNVFLMLCGHWPQVGRTTNVFNENTIYTCLSDYENLTNGGSGYLRLVQFSPSNNVMGFYSYSPQLGEYKTTPDQRFDLPFNGAVPEPAFTVLDSLTTTGVTTLVSTLASGLSPGRSYDWYVSVTSGTNQTVGPVWRFATAESPVYSPPSFQIIRTLRNSLGQFLICWRSVGGLRYRIEYSDGDSNGGFNGVFQELVRPVEQETDPAAPGAPSLQAFTDDFTLTGLPGNGARYYRIKQVP